MAVANRKGEIMNTELALIIGLFLLAFLAGKMFGPLQRLWGRSIREGPPRPRPKPKPRNKQRIAKGKGYNPIDPGIHKRLEEDIKIQWLKEKILFIGGPEDGKKHIYSSRPVYEIPYWENTMVNRPPQLPDRRLATYKLRHLEIGEKRFIFYVIDKMDMIEAVKKLVDGYKP